LPFQSSINAHLDYFLTIVSNAATCIAIQMSLPDLISLLLDMYTEVVVCVLW
jgi:hypothetical protein